MEVLLMAIFSLSNIACFLIGAKVGQKVVNQEKIELPTVNPMKAYREHQARKEAEMEKSKIDTILRNIDNYDGTPYGQEDV
jgi:hypothetical protein